MALPKDNPNAATDAVAAEIKKMGPKDLAALPDLDGADLQLIGTLIQYFSFMDLNLRRALETFHAEKMLPREYAKLWPDSLADSTLTEALGHTEGAPAFFSTIPAACTSAANMMMKRTSRSDVISEYRVTGRRATTRRPDCDARPRPRGSARSCRSSRRSWGRSWRSK